MLTLEYSLKLQKLGFASPIFMRCGYVAASDEIAKVKEKRMKDLMMNERPIPPAVIRDQNSVEMLRVWIAEHKLHCSLKIGMYREMNIREDVAWGTILADAARHIAKALSEESKESENTLFEIIRSQFNAELDVPTSPVSGSFAEP